MLLPEALGVALAEWNVPMTEGGIVTAYSARKCPRKSRYMVGIVDSVMERGRPVSDIRHRVRRGGGGKRAGVKAFMTSILAVMELIAIYVTRQLHRARELAQSPSRSAPT